MPDLDAVRRGQCAYCQAALPHAVLAAAQAMAVEQLMQDRDGDGLPDGLQTLQHAQTRLKKQQRIEQQVRHIRGQIHAAEHARMPPASHLLIGGFGFAVIGGLGWAVVTGPMLGSDPWLGAHADLFCPQTCRGCEGPYDWRLPHFGAIYCRHPDSTVGEDWSTMILDREANERFEVDYGMIGMALCSIATWFLPGVILAFLLARRSIAAKRRSLESLREQLYHAEQIQRAVTPPR